MDWRELAKQSMGGREWKETIKRFSGDPALSAQYLPIARAILGKLNHHLRLGGIEQGHRVVLLPDGTRIRVLHISGINIVEVVTYPTFVEEFFGKTSGGFIFYPRTDSVPNGLYTPAGPAISYPLRAAPFAPFATLGYQYVEDTGKYKLKASAPARKQAGNQFFFSSDGVCYSWWHSSRGDGPISFSDASIPANYNRVLYTTFISGERVAFFTYPSRLTYLYAVVYKGGNPWWSIPTSGELLAGFWCGKVKLPDGTTQTRYIVAVSNLRQQRIRFIVGINPVPLTGTEIKMTNIPTSPAYIEWRVGAYAGVRGQWPIRFSASGKSAATLLYTAIDDSDYANAFYDSMLLTELEIEHTVDACIITKKKDTYYNCGVVSTKSVRHYSSTIEDIPRANGGLSSGVAQGHLSLDTYYGNVYSIEKPEIPIGLNYDENRLVLATVTFQQPARGTTQFYGEGTFDATVTEDDYVRDGTGITDFYTYATDYSFSGGGKQVADYGVYKINLDQETLYIADETAFNLMEFTTEKTSVRNYSSRSLSVFSDLSASFHTRLVEFTQTSAGESYRRDEDSLFFCIYYFDIKRKILLRYESDASAEYTGTFNSVADSKEHLEIRAGNTVVNTGYSSSEVKTTGEYKYNGGIFLEFNYKDVDHFSEPAALAETGKSELYTHTDGNSYNGVWPNHNPESWGSTQGVNNYEAWPAIPTYSTNSFEWELLKQTNYLYANLRGEYINVYEDTPVRVSLLDRLERLFKPRLLMTFSMAIDDREASRDVWAYSFYVDDKAAVLDYSTQDVKYVPIKSIKTNSTFGSLNQHIFLLDADDKMTDQPVNDSTLTVYPIGLY